MRPRLILHIGPHKTGTTYLQSRLLQQADWLRSELGINYVQAGIGPQYGHHKLCAELIRGGSSDAWDGLRDEWHRYPCHILSSENFSRLPQQAVVELARRVGALDVEVCYFVRTPAPVLYGAWQESVKHGSSLNLHEFCSPHLAAPESSILLNPEICLRPYLASFSGRLRLLSYDAIMLTGHNLLASFFSAFHLGAPEWTDNAVVNKSLRLGRAELLRSLNALEQVHLCPEATAQTRSPGKPFFNAGIFLGVLNGKPDCAAALLHAQRLHRREFALGDESKLHGCRQGFLAQHEEACIGPWSSGSTPQTRPATVLPWIQSAWLQQPGVHEALVALAQLVRTSQRKETESASAPPHGEPGRA